jgi:lipid-A-disaccharide synthase-like uncharacterized protein
MLSLNGWLVVGFLGQALFTARFVVQWLVSERNRDSVVPVAFWWFSLFGGLALLAYAVSRHDPVIIFGQAMGLVVYVRNLMLVAKAKRRAAKQEARSRRIIMDFTRVHDSQGMLASEGFPLSVHPKTDPAGAFSRVSTRPSGHRTSI